MLSREPRPGEDQQVSSFYISTADTDATRGRRVLKNADCFAVLDDSGGIHAEGGAAEGLFFEDTRHLSRLLVTVDQVRPLLLSSTVTDDDVMLTADLINPDLIHEGRLRLTRATVHILSSIFLGEDSLFQSLELRNYGMSSTHLLLAVHFAADFADIFEVRGSARRQRGAMLHEERGREQRLLAYRGLDGVLRRTRLSFDPPEETERPLSAGWHLNLPPGGSQTIRLAVRCEHAGRSTSAVSADACLAAQRSRVAARKLHNVGLETDDEAFNSWLDRSRADLEMLATETAHGLYPYAGIPWFSTAFGRDGLITSLECLWLDPELAAGVLRYLAAQQATTTDRHTDAEPGKILHETRKGEMAKLGEVPFGRYYGSIDSTPLFLILLEAYHARTGDLDLVRGLWPNAEAAFDWMKQYGDADGDGFLEYKRKSADGLSNQGWKDSSDAIFHADGSLAEGPIALAEVQAYAYAAYRGGARLASALDLPPRVKEFTLSAERLKDRFEAAFWREELGTYALALDGNKEPCAVRASNAGHVLFAGLASAARAERVAGSLTGDELFTGWGVRTVGTGEKRYNPVAYHNGSVWPHDNALIAMGFSRYGLKAPLLRLLDGMFGVAQFMPLGRLPELFCGFPRRTGAGPTSYPVSCSPQAWSSATVFAMLGAALGISYAPRERQIRFSAPALPPGVNELRMTNLCLAGASVDLLLRRNAEVVELTVLRRKGQVEIVLTG